MNSFRETIDRVIRTFGAPNPEWIFGLRVYVDPSLPIVPSPGEVGRRIVRHGMKDVLEWLGGDVGPAPDEITQCFVFKHPVTGEEALFMSRQLYQEIRVGVDPLVHRAYDDRGKDALQTVWTAWKRARRAGIL